MILVEYNLRSIVRKLTYNEILNSELSLTAYNNSLFRAIIKILLNPNYYASSLNLTLHDTAGIRNVVV